MKIENKTFLFSKIRTFFGFKVLYSEYITISTYLNFSGLYLGVLGGVMNKWLKLAVLGIVVFSVLLGVFIVIFPAAPAEFADGDAAFVELEPYFVTQFFEQNPNYTPPTSEKIVIRQGDESEIKLVDERELVLSESGFPLSELVLSGSTSLNVSNNSGKVHSFVVVSPAFDGTSYSIAEFVIPAGGEVSLGFFVDSYLNDIIEKGNVQVEKTDKGILVFEVACVLNCEEGSSNLTVFASVD